MDGYINANNYVNRDAVLYYVELYAVIRVMSLPILHMA